LSIDDLQSAISNQHLAIDHGLLRVIGVRRLVASAINVTIGAGIFVLPATVAAGLGPAAPVAYLLCGGIMVLIILCFAAAGSRVTSTGGLYAYVEVAFGRFVGFLTGVLYCLSASLAAASVASALAASVAAVWPVAATVAARFGLLTAVVGGLAVVNLRGVTPGARLVEAVTLAKLLPLVALIVAGVWFVRGERLVFTTLPAASTVGRTAIVLIFAFVGVEIALVPGGEVSDPARTVPRALFIALAATTVIYLAIQTVALGLLGPSMADYSAAPLAEAMARVLGPGGRLFVLAGATMSMFGYLAGDMLGSPRALFALARDRMLPAPLARVHPRYHTPYVAIVTYAIIVGAGSVSSSFAELAIVTNVSTLSMYLLCVLASYQLQRRGVRGGGPPFAMPGGPLVPALATTAILWLLSHATAREIALEAVVLGIASVYYLIASISPSSRETSASS
jgi:APA family basic amino acid/polyamine antiporter